MQATALEQEAYLRLCVVPEGNQEPQWRNRRQFFEVAAEAMRRILLTGPSAKGESATVGRWSASSWLKTWFASEELPDDILSVNEVLDQLDLTDSSHGRAGQAR